MRRHAEKNRVTEEDIEDIKELILEGLKPLPKES